MARRAAGAWSGRVGPGENARTPGLRQALGAKARRPRLADREAIMRCRPRNLRRRADGAGPPVIGRARRRIAGRGTVDRDRDRGRPLPRSASPPRAGGRDHDRRCRRPGPRPRPKRSSDPDMEPGTVPDRDAPSRSGTGPSARPGTTERAARPAWRAPSGRPTASIVSARTSRPRPPSDARATRGRGRRTAWAASRPGARSPPGQGVAKDPLERFAICLFTHLTLPTILLV